ncbi:MAG: hypothetical protein JJT94_03500 [Bernardetiaceae bacterium]|nr:hypothetical protein [Bernardetiaceae bacterium]
MLKEKFGKDLPPHFQFVKSISKEADNSYIITFVDSTNISRKSSGFAHLDANFKLIRYIDIKKLEDWSGKNSVNYGLRLGYSTDGYVANFVNLRRNQVYLTDDSLRFKSEIKVKKKRKIGKQKYIHELYLHTYDNKRDRILTSLLYLKNSEKNYKERYWKNWEASMQKKHLMAEISLQDNKEVYATYGFYPEIYDTKKGYLTYVMGHDVSYDAESGLLFFSFEATPKLQVWDTKKKKFVEVFGQRGAYDNFKPENLVYHKSDKAYSIIYMNRHFIQNPLYYAPYYDAQNELLFHFYRPALEDTTVMDEDYIAERTKIINGEVKMTQENYTLKTMLEQQQLKIMRERPAFLQVYKYGDTEKILLKEVQIPSHIREAHIIGSSDEYIYISDNKYLSDNNNLVHISEFYIYKIKISDLQDKSKANLPQK